MKTSNPFQYARRLNLCRSEAGVRCHATHQSLDRFPERHAPEQIRPGVWSAWETPDAKKRRSEILRRAPGMSERCRRWFSRIEARNLQTAKENPEALLALGRGCLKWYECLPPGVDYATAARFTGESFSVDVGFRGGLSRVYREYRARRVGDSVEINGVGCYVIMRINQNGVFVRHGDGSLSGPYAPETVKPFTGE